MKFKNILILIFKLWQGRDPSLRRETGFEGASFVLKNVLSSPTFVRKAKDALAVWSEQRNTRW